MEIEKTVSQSQTEQIHIIMQQHINGAGRLFGGQLMEWIDVVAAVVARRHSNCEVTTACVDSLTFRAPAHLNDTVVIRGKITWVGNTSMEVRCDTFIEHLNGKHEMINTAFVILVALDKNEMPCTIPRLILNTSDEYTEYENAIKRDSLRLNKEKLSDFAN